MASGWFGWTCLMPDCFRSGRLHLTQHCHHQNGFTLTPSLPQPVIFPRRKVHTYTTPNSIFDGHIANLLSVLYVLIEIFSRAHPKGVKNFFKWFQIWHFYWSFSEWRSGKHGSERVKMSSGEKHFNVLKLLLLLLLLLYQYTSIILIICHCQGKGEGKVSKTAFINHNYWREPNFFNCESHFNVSYIVGGRGKIKSQRHRPWTTTFNEKGEPKRNRTEVLLSTSLTRYR